jgi:hypothetical protein
MKIKLLNIISLCFITACKQSDPPPVPEVIEKGDLFFSGYYWNIKNSLGNNVGPGPNKFSGSSDNIWLDKDGMLHLKITKYNNLWYCSEVISVKEFGYGTYIFTTASDLTTFSEKTVLGLFTWNNHSFQSQANSEVDVEFARWNNLNDSQLLTYSVQPVWFDNAAPYIERTNRPRIPVSALKGPSTHVFKWTADSIRWESYTGDQYPGGKLLASWSYHKNNISRRKLEGSGLSDPIVIPAPEDSTNVRFNLWLLFGQPPANGKEQEAVIKSFRHIPL